MLREGSEAVREGKVVLCSRLELVPNISTEQSKLIVLPTYNKREAYKRASERGSSEHFLDIILSKFNFMVHKLTCAIKFYRLPYVRCNFASEWRTSDIFEHSDLTIEPHYAAFEDGRKIFYLHKECLLRYICDSDHHSVESLSKDITLLVTSTSRSMRICIRAYILAEYDLVEALYLLYGLPVRHHNEQSKSMHRISYDAHENLPSESHSLRCTREIDLRYDRDDSKSSYSLPPMIVTGKPYNK